MELRLAAPGGGPLHRQFSTMDVGFCKASWRADFWLLAGGRRARMLDCLSRLQSSPSALSPSLTHFLTHFQSSLSPVPEPSWRFRRRNQIVSWHFPHWPRISFFRVCWVRAIVPSAFHLLEVYGSYLLHSPHPPFQVNAFQKILSLAFQWGFERAWRKHVFSTSSFSEKSKQRQPRWHL